MPNFINHSGSVEDIRCALGYINPKQAGKHAVESLQASLDNEKNNHYNRATVIKMLETKLRQIAKANANKL